LAAEGELAVDDGAAEAAFGVVVGRLDSVSVGEGPERGPAVEEVPGELPVVLGSRALARCVFEDRAELDLEWRDLTQPLRKLGANPSAGKYYNETAEFSASHDLVRGLLVAATRLQPKSPIWQTAFRIYSHTRPVVNGESRDRPERVREPGFG
jgi:hypothetical protein